MRKSLWMCSALWLVGCGATEAVVEVEDDGSGGTEQALGSDPFYAISPEQDSFDATQAQRVRSLGAGLVRFEVRNWPNETARLDGLVADARAQQLQVLLELHYGTYDPGIPMGRARVDYWHKGFTDQGNPFAVKYGQIAGEVAKRYAGKVAWYEIWNEPDSAPQGPQENPNWDGACGLGPKPYTYGVTDWSNGQLAGDPWSVCPRQLAVLAAKAFPAIRAADPAARVVAGNMLMHGTDGWVGTEYWRQVELAPATAAFKAANGRRPWDAVGFHPYHAVPNANDLGLHINRMAAVLSSQQDGSKLAITEYGWRTGVGSMADDWVDEATQAAFLRSTFSYVKSRGLAFMMWFNFQDGAAGSGYAYGVRRYSGTWKPSARAFCEAAGATATCPVRGADVGKLSDGSSDAPIVACHTRNGGAPAVGAPFDNGGGAYVHGFGAGQVQDFQGGTLGPNLCMHQGRATTAFMVRGSIRTEYLANGGATGFLGYPLGDESAGRQSFEGGTIAWDSAAGRYRATRGPNRPPRGNLDLVTATRVSGWANDPDAVLQPCTVNVYRDGVRVRTVTANVRRDDLITAGVAPNPEHGFSIDLATGPGTHRFEARAVDTTTQAETVLWNARSVTFP